MNVRHLSSASLAAALFVLAGCGGTTAVPQSAAVAPANRAGVHRTTGGSGDLLYVDDGGVDYFGAYVLIYTYPEGKHVATLTGFRRLTGECSDADGNVFIIAPAEESSNPTTIYEFAHGGSTPIATLTEPGLGYGCAIDPTTGNLAVANLLDYSNPYRKDYGDVAIFPGATGNPTMYYSSKFANFWNCGYDVQGNLYLSAEASSGFSLASLNAGSGSSIKPVNLKTKLYGAYAFAPAVQWDGTELTVSSTLKQTEGKESGPVNVYRLSISGQNATVIGTTKLDAPQERHRGQSWIQGNTIIGITYYHGRPKITFWKFPKGGNPARQITHAQKPAASLLVGVTVSVAPSK